MSVYEILLYGASPNVEVYEDLEFNSENSEELTLNYITESFSHYSITWRQNQRTQGNKQLIVYYVSDTFSQNNPQEISYPLNNSPSQNMGNDNAPYQIEKEQTFDLNGRTYKLQGVSYLNRRYNNTVAYNFIDGCDYVQYFYTNHVVLYWGSSDGWWYSSSPEQGDDINIIDFYWNNTILTNRTRFSHISNQSNECELYVVYYPLLKFHWGIIEDGVYSEMDSKDMDGNITLGNDAYAQQAGYYDNNEYELKICTNYNDVTGTIAPASVRNGYQVHPNSGLDYYFVYVRKPLPVPTGVTQKAAPYAAMVILAAVSAAVMIKRRKGGDVDETSPL